MDQDLCNTTTERETQRDWRGVRLSSKEHFCSFRGTKKFFSQHVFEALPEDPASSFGGQSCVRVPFLAFSSQISTELKASLRCVGDEG